MHPYQALELKPSDYSRNHEGREYQGIAEFRHYIDMKAVQQKLREKGLHIYTSKAGNFRYIMLAETAQLQLAEAELRRVAVFKGEFWYSGQSSRE